MNTLLRIIVIAVSLLLSACASDASKEHPAWILDETPEYTNARYLLGRGQADQVDMAKDRARADVAKIFSVRVTERNQDLTRFQSAGSGAAQGSPQLEQEVSRQLSATTDELLRGVTIAETWQDPQTKAYHALAVLPRQDASRDLRREIDQLDAAIAGYVRQARESGDLLQRIGQATRAVRTHAQRDGLAQSLAVVERMGRGAASPYSTGQLEADLQQLLQGINISVENARDEPGQDAKDLLSAAVHTVGFSQDANRAADYVLTGGLELDEPKKIQGVFWVTGSLKITLRQPATLQARGSKRWPLKGGSSVDAALAERKAREQAQELINRDLSSALVEFAGL